MSDTGRSPSPASRGRRKSEAELEAFFHRRVRLVGGMSVKVAPTEAGVPDRLVLMPGGRMYLVELKTEKGSLAPIQKHWAARAAALGTRVVTLHGQEGVLRWLRCVVDSVGPTGRPGRPRRPASDPCLECESTD